MTRVFKTIIGLDDSSDILLCDTIEHEGAKWLVPRWLEAPSEGWKKPQRIICLDPLPHQKLQGAFPAEYLLNDPMPRSVFEGRPRQQGERAYVVIEEPDIRIAIPRGIH